MSRRRASPLDGLDGAVRAKLRAAPPPRRASPMLAVLEDEPFSDDDWVFERKLDGMRVVAFKRGGRVRLRSRNDTPQDDVFPELVDALEQDPADDFVVDGEVVAFSGRVTSFARLQGRLKLSDPAAARASGIAVRHYFFDVLHCDGHDTTRLPLRTRKGVLRRLLDFRDPLRYTPHRNARGEELLREACAKGWEGLIAKRADAPYARSRSRDWLKLKCSAGQELVVVGYTDPSGSRKGFGALLLGYHDAGSLRYAGRVGTGFDDATLADLSRRLEARERTTSPLDEPSDAEGPGVHWVRPDLVCQVAFTEWTRDGRLRHPRFEGLRADKDARDVVREEAGG